MTIAAIEIRILLACVSVTGIVCGASPAAAEEASEKTAGEVARSAEQAYEARDWRQCAVLYARASRLAGPSARSDASYNAACCHALAGDPDAAFAELERAAEAGYRDLAHLRGDSDLAGLHDDPRWQEIVSQVEATVQAYRRTINVELLELYTQDQADRRADRYEDIDWSTLAPRDEARRKRVNEIVDAGGARVADDYFHAAMVFQHGTEPEQIKQARDWARRAVELDPDHDSAKWLAAASEDRYLMYQEKPQKYGTQFRKVDGRWILWEVDPEVSDEERARWNVPPLSEAEERVKVLNRQAQEK